MSEPKIRPYGTWKSPINGDVVVSKFITPRQIALDRDDIYWLEGRPAEGGRNVLVRRTSEGQTQDCTPAGFNVRTRVHEYGGGGYVVTDGVIYFANFADQRLYRYSPEAELQPVTSTANMRYADGVVDQRRGRMICVREDHSTPGQVVNTLVGLNLEGDVAGEVLVSENDFYSSPRLSPDGSWLAWLTWNQPNMPWDGTELWVAAVRENGTLGQSQLVAGGISESIFQPEWSPQGILHFVSDRTGWWNLYRWREGQIEPLGEMEAEFGQAQWVCGMSLYGFESEQQIICAYTQGGLWRLARLDTSTKKLAVIETPYSEIREVRVGRGYAVFLGGSPAEPLSIVKLDLSSHRLEVIRRAREVGPEAAYLSTFQAIEFPTEHGLTAYGFFYPPRNPDYLGPPDERPPLLVMSHGGPTASTSIVLQYDIQYWTSRGIAVLDVNYSGSTGYGRAYRQRLNGQWGIADVDDCVNGARYLVEQGQVDGKRLAITGGSAGGYTTLCALTFRDSFKAGASYYGISDLEMLAQDTHKFEARYLDGLVGPYPERADIYRARSPIHFTERLACPMILFQGLEDEVVPPNQAEKMFEAVRAKGLPVAYLTFAGEQHGFRRAENIKRALEAQLYFYSKVFGFELAEPIEPVPIENLDQ